MKRVIEDSLLTDIADAIREKSGTEESLEVTEMAGAIREIENDNAILDARLDGSLVSIFNDRVAMLTSSAFQGCNHLEYVEMPNVRSIGYGAFTNDGALKKAVFDSVTSILSMAFGNCRNLTDVILGNRAGLQAVNAFQSCPAIIYVKQSDLEWYSTATNWSSLYAEGRIKAIEEAENE